MPDVTLYSRQQHHQPYTHPFTFPQTWKEASGGLTSGIWGGGGGVAREMFGQGEESTTVVSSLWDKGDAQPA